MRTVSVPLPAPVYSKLERAAKRRKKRADSCVREALAEHVSRRKPNGKSSCYDLTQDLAGFLRGGPRDLASNKGHLRGYGR